MASTTTLVIGRPGTTLLTIPRMAARGYTRTAGVGATVRRTIGGTYTADRAPRLARVWELSWRWLSDAERRDLTALFSGQYGPGPYILLDPACQNFLAGNQASGTDQEMSAAGFAVAGGEALASTSATAARGSRSLVWSLPPAGVTSGVLAFAPPASLTGFPVVAGEPWTFAAQVAGGAGASGAVTVTAALAWLRSDRSLLSSTLGTSAAISASFAQLSVVGAVPPGGAMWVEPQLRVAPGSVTGTPRPAGSEILRYLPTRPAAAVATFAAAGAGRTVLAAAPANRSPAAAPVMAWTNGAGMPTVDVFVDDAALTRTTTVIAWMPGEGVPLVSAVAMPEAVPFIERRDMSMTLIEIG